MPAPLTIGIGTAAAIGLAAGGFAYATHLTDSDPQMFADIMRTNRDNIARRLDLYIAELEAMRDAIAADSPALKAHFEEARALLERRAVVENVWSRDEVLEAWCEVISEQGAWAEANDVADRAGRHAGWAEVPPLALYATRLEARAAVAAGDVERGTSLLRSSAEGFAGLGAAWEEAITNLELATALTDLGADEQARMMLRDAVAVFDRLGSARELDRANDTLERLS